MGGVVESPPPPAPFVEGLPEGPGFRGICILFVMIFLIIIPDDKSSKEKGWLQGNSTADDLACKTRGVEEVGLTKHVEASEHVGCRSSISSNMQMSLPINIHSTSGFTSMSFVA